MLTKNKSDKPMMFDLDIVRQPDSFALLINPSNLNLKFAPKISEQRIRWTSENIGYVFQAHHDELDVLTASGISAMFVSFTHGITRENRTNTMSYNNIQQLIALYRNNGTNVNPKSGQTINPCMIDSVGRVVITYDGFIYRGHFISFTITENDEKPFNINFSFEFKVTQMLNIGNVLQQQFFNKSTQQQAFNKNK